MKRIFASPNLFTADVVLRATVRDVMAQVEFKQQLAKLIDPTATEREMQDVAGQVTRSTYLDMLKGSFANEAVFAESESLQRSAVGRTDFSLAIAPITPAGTNTMVAVLQEGKTIASYVGNRATKTVYYVSPGSAEVFSLADCGLSERFFLDRQWPLKDQRVVACERNGYTSSAIAMHVAKSLFKELLFAHDIADGFINLWNGNVGGIILPRRPEGIWNLAPLMLISERLGFIFMHLQDGTVTPFVPEVQQAPCEHHDIVVVHQSHESDVLQKTLMTV